MGAGEGSTRNVSARLGLCAVVASAALAVAPMASADIIDNGGFEDGDFTGWIDLNNLNFSTVQCPGQPAAFEGECYAQLGPDHLASLAQTANTTTAGHPYFVSFAYASDGASPATFVATFGGVPLISRTQLGDTGGYIQRTFLVTAPQDDAVLQFDVRNDLGFISLDAVRITAVPEPATLGLISIALTGLVWRRRR